MRTAQIRSYRQRWPNARPEYRQTLVGEWEAVCAICELEQDEHINNVYCPEWRLRQMDGDR